ncbi:MAG: hypothetical protein ABI895_14075 [Deltaproteobacteria bacterium]
MPRFGLPARRVERRKESRSSRWAALGALLLSAACARFDFETLPDVQLPIVLDNGGGPPDPSDGCEAARDSLQSCGSCNQLCALTNVEVSCAGGSCQPVQCRPGFGDCDSDIRSNGCERELNTLTHCGGCGVPCSLPNGTTSCDTGVCQLVSCANGFDDCDADPSTGCETRLDTLTDCGRCGTTCFIAGAQDLNCSGGVCSAARCAAFLADCDGDSVSCETDLRTLGDCVGCNVPCGDQSGHLANGTASCSGGSCGIGVCDSGFGDCDASPGNGCETQLNSLVDCAGCDVPCNRANGSESCASGSCQTVSCDPGFDDCDGDDSTGCEAQLGTDAHCGGCNQACGSNETCSTGSCVGVFNTFQPSNVNVGSLNSGSAPDVLLDCGTINLDTGSLGGNGWCGRPGPAPVVRTQPAGPDLVVLPMKSLQIALGSTFRVLGSRPVALVVFGDVNVAGTIDVSANGSSGGPGNNWNCNANLNGGDTRSDGGPNGGGGGGALGSTGGIGGSSAASGGGVAGQPRGTSLLSPLIPGCNGGWGGGCGAGPGSGGGALEIAATGRVEITGSVLSLGANGVNGCDSSGGATGGGSGGGLLIEANQVFLSGGSLLAEGGRGGRGANGGNGGLGGTSGAGQPGTSVGANGGGGGGGSTGRIRISGAQGCALSGSISPAAVASCP